MRALADLLGRVIAAAVFVAAFPAVAAAIDIQVVRSPGGIEAWLVEEHAIPLVVMNVGFNAGARYDPEGKEGLANMLSGTLDEGAGDMESSAFQARLEDLAIRLSFDAGRDTFTGNVQTLTENRDEAFRLLGLALTAPRFDEEPVERIRSQILARIARNSTDPNTIASDLWLARVLPDHPYGRRVEGTAESVKAISRPDLETFTRTWLARDRLKVVVVGDIDAATLAPLLDKTFAGLPATSPSGELPPAEVVEPDGAAMFVVRQPIPQSVMVFGHQGLKRKDPDFIPAYVMNYILGGGGFASRLIDEVRGKRGLAYNIYSYLYPLDAGGLYIGGLGTQNARASESIALVRAEVGRMAANGVTEEELNDAKTYLTGSYPLRFDSNSAIASQLLGIRLEELGIDYVDKRNDMVRAVTREDIARVARRVLNPEKLVVVVVGDPENMSGKGVVEIEAP